MYRLPNVTCDEAIQAFNKAGFIEVRRHSSHRILKKTGHKYLLSVPDHGSSPLKPGTLRQLIRASDLTIEQFVALLR